MKSETNQVRTVKTSSWNDRGYLKVSKYVLGTAEDDITLIEGKSAGINITRQDTPAYIPNLTVNNWRTHK